MNDGDVDYARSEQAGTPVLAVSGEIDLASAGRFAQELALLVGEERDAARVDLSAVTFLDSSGVRELLAANRQAAANGRRLLLANPSAACRRVLEISGVWSEFVVEGAQSA
jgi:anti-sigma B factor antagonist